MVLANNSGWSVDGVALDDLQGRWFVEWSTAVPAPGAQRVAQLELSRRNGVVSKRQSWGLGSVKLSIAARAQKGTPVAGSTQILVGVLARAQTVTRKAGARTITADVVTSVVSEPRRISAEGAWIVECTFMVSPFWWQGNAVTSASKTIPGEVLFTEWAGTTGDIVDGILRVRGPLTKVNITAVDGTGVSFEHALTSSQYAYVDPVNMRAWRGGASQWTPSSTLIPLDWLTEGPLVLSPGVDGVALTVTAEGADSETSAMVLRGRKWWL